MSITVVYATPPLSGGESWAKPLLERFCLRNGTKQTKVPVAFQRRQALARFHVPDLDGLVFRCRHDGLAVGRKIARKDPITAIFLKCQGTHM